MGVEHILFAIDWPYVNNIEATDWFGKFPIDDDGRRAILSGNAQRLLRL